MKKIILIVVAVVMFFVTGTSFAQESDKAATFIDMQNNSVMPKNGTSQQIQNFMGWWQYKSFGGVLEAEYRSQSHYERLKPSLLWKVSNSVYLLGGLSSDNLKSDFIQAGIWYVDNFGKASVLIDARNYFSITSQNNGYTDNLLRVMYPIGKGFSIGTDLVYDHWWEGQAHSWYLVGPRISYKLTNEISLYGRVSHEWDVKDIGTDTGYRVRVGLAMIF